MSFMSRILGKKADTQWWVASFEEDEQPVVVRARSTMPVTPDPKEYPRLAVITWNYDGVESGMPSTEENVRMSELEDILEARMEKKGICLQTASRTGCGHREWNYYARSEEQFMDALNRALGSLPPFPIEIAFYDDPDWQSFRDLLTSKE
jgi:Family of unknown function (DUF695)